ncbi:hypothetical protein CYPRO_3139 [Cyclonatronum proteinivorum]|uniref:Circularly permuted ATP-grasp type 2 n=1 Tax=Cyclonatronum proteinivorum TaxID=1457365 RepID=A0A345UPH1_9BACT|nr:hypothetical protein [Cyclonatronum proteinivorum]AXJ02373.1 hypothetical protein CYPRO_3139 [Cyclonatronum proteinivorum]
MLSPSKPAVDYYNHLIASDLSAATEQHEMLLEMQRTQNVMFGDRPLTQSLRPMVMGERTFQYIHDTVYVIRQAILKIAATFFNSRKTLDHLGLTPYEIELCAIPTNVIRMSATARLDSFLTDNSFKFVELNAEVPAGIAYMKEMADIYQKLPIFQKFIERYPVRFVSPLEHTFQGLIRIYHEEFGGLKEKPSFAIVDHLDVPTYPEFVLIKEYLERLGYEAEICDPRELECRDGWIYANGKKIDILYRRLLMNEFFEIQYDCQAYLEGYKAQKTCYLNSFRSKLVHKKMIFALLTDPDYNHVLDQSELKAIRDHIPWTRKLKPSKVRYRGANQDLLELIRRNKDSFIMKPNDDYGGHGVVLGFQESQDTWETAISHALQLDYVVQEVIEIGRQPFLLPIEGNWESVNTVIDFDPYLNGPMMSGCLTRTSPSNLANVTAGGGSIPLFIARYL